MEKSNFVIQLMDISLDAAQEMCEEFSRGNNFLYTMSTTANRSKICRGVCAAFYWLGVLLKKHAFSVVGKTFAGEDRCKHYLQMEKPRKSYNVQRIANNCSSPSPAATLDDEQECFSRAGSN
jgi:hypothetical protein